MQTYLRGSVASLVNSYPLTFSALLSIVDAVRWTLPATVSECGTLSSSQWDAASALPLNDSDRGCNARVDEARMCRERNAASERLMAASISSSISQVQPGFTPAQYETYRAAVRSIAKRDMSTGPDIAFAGTTITGSVVSRSWARLTRGISSSSRSNSTDHGTVTLANLSAGGRKYRRRRARGGGDKQAGRGMNGQRSRRGTGKPSLFFEGGQTPMWKRLPKRGAHNPFSYSYDSVLLTDIDVAIRSGRLDPARVITMKHLYDAGLIEKKAYNRNGVAVLAALPTRTTLRRLQRKVGLPKSLNFEIPIELEVARITQRAREAVEQAGGRVTRVYYNPLGMRALLLPGWFEKKGRLLPRAVQLVPFSKRWRYDRPGQLPAPDAPALPELDQATA